MITNLDLSCFGFVSQRYENEFSIPMPQSAAQAYDVIAVASCPVRAKGNAALTKNYLENISGFRGSMGLLRFRADGLIERIFGVSKVQAGKIVVVEPAAKIF